MAGGPAGVAGGHVPRARGVRVGGCAGHTLSWQQSCSGMGRRRAAVCRSAGYEGAWVAASAGGAVGALAEGHGRGQGRGALRHGQPRSCPGRWVSHHSAPLGADMRCAPPAAPPARHRWAGGLRVPHGRLGLRGPKLSQGKSLWPPAPTTRPGCRPLPFSQAMTCRRSTAAWSEPCVSVYRLIRS